MTELRKKMKVTDQRIYQRVREIADSYLISKEDAANLLAVELGIRVSRILSELELKRLRDVQKPIVVRPEPVEKRGVEKVPSEMPTPSPNMLYDLLQLHPRIVEVSRSLFRSGHYSQAIFEAFKCVGICVKGKSALQDDGQTLMAKAFNEHTPVIKLNELKTPSEIDEQMGFKLVFMGAMTGIRNPKAHDIVTQKDPYKTLEYLALASLLARRVDEGTKA